MKKKGVPMTKSSNKLHMWVWLLVLPLLQLGSGVAFAQGQPAAAEPKSVVGQAAAQVDYSTLTGTDACFHCHKDTSEQISKTVHTGSYDTGTNAPRTSANASCDGCHGPTKPHADAELLAEKNDTKDPEAKKLIFDFGSKSSTPDVINKRCLTCHASGPTHLNSANSFHRQNDVSCIDCHSPHHAATKEKLLVKTEPGLCYSCHLQQKSQFNMPFRHRVNEGLIRCTDCHNQHGTDGVWESGDLIRQVRTSDSGDTVCFKCHKDKQGPFVWAHASVKVAGCAACHIPHGGANLHMLKYSNVNLLCLSCHTASAFGHGPNGTSPTTGFPVMDAQNSTQQQGCPLCHVQVHGSNFSNLLFR